MPQVSENSFIWILLLPLVAQLVNNWLLILSSRVQLQLPNEHAGENRKKKNMFGHQRPVEAAQKIHWLLIISWRVWNQLIGESSILITVFRNLWYLKIIVFDHRFIICTVPMLQSHRNIQMTSVFAFGGVGGQVFLNFITYNRLISNCHNKKGTGRINGGITTKGKWK